MKDGTKLYSQLVEYTHCALDSRRFLPENKLEAFINDKSVRAELGYTGRDEVVSKVVSGAKKVFAILVIMDKVDRLSALLDEGLRDAHLPLSLDPSLQVVLSHDKSHQFLFHEWRIDEVKRLVDEYQGPYLAPTLEADSQYRKLDERLPLPFIEAQEIASGGGGCIYRAKLHPNHQRGFGDVNRPIAVKQFFKEAYFDQENGILQKIKRIQDPHIIRHFASIASMASGRKFWYILFPWTDIGDLFEYWKRSPRAPFDALVPWSIQQMQGLVRALRKLHVSFGLRHGDLKPQNILCFPEDPDRGPQQGPVGIVLKIADFGISKVHLTLTRYRAAATTSKGLTLSYGAPEVELERAPPGSGPVSRSNDDDRGKKQQQDHQPEAGTPRSRKYDVWSLGCVYLEFFIWLLWGHDALLNFNNARTYIPTTGSLSTPLYQITFTDKNEKKAQVHHLASRTIEFLQKDPRCARETVLHAVLELIRDKMLMAKVEERATAEEVEQEFARIMLEKEERSLPFFNPCEGVEIPPIDFDELQREVT